MSERDKFLIELLEDIRDNIKELRVDAKEMKEDMSSIKVSDALQNEQLAEHMRRTEINELALEELRRYIDEALSKIAPKSFDWKKFINWIVGIGVSISGILVALNRLGVI